MDLLIIHTTTSFKSSQGHIDIRDYGSHYLFLEAKRQILELLELVRVEIKYGSLTRCGRDFKNNFLEWSGSAIRS
jgi:hypothetical protein